MTQGHPPALAILAGAGARTAGQDAALPAVDQVIFHACLLQQFGATIERVAFADGVEVDFDARLEEPHGPALAVQCQPLTTHPLQGLADVGFLRKAALASKEAPDLG